MKVNLNSLKTFFMKRSCISRMIAVCMLLVTCTMNSVIPVQAAPIIDTTTAQTVLIPGAYNAQTSSVVQNISSAQMVSTPGSTGAQLVSTPGTATGQTILTPGSAAVQTVASPATSDLTNTTSSGATGVGECWMLDSTTGAQNLSIVIKSPHGKLIVIDGGWEADATKLSELILQQGGKVDAWLITHPHEDHVGALCTILNDTARKIKIDKIYCSLATPGLVSSGFSDRSRHRRSAAECIYEASGRYSDE